MFERYTDRARRVLFFGRYEASKLGALSITPEHLLLGLIRENDGITKRVFARARLSPDDIRKEIEGRTIAGDKVPDSVEIPFAADTRRVLQLATKEADRLLHHDIDAGHLHEPVRDGRIADDTKPDLPPS